MPGDSSPLDDWAQSAGAVCCRVDACPYEPESILSANEHRQWLAMRAVEKRRREWLLGRYAAKEAVQRLLDVRLTPQSIEIVPDSNGRPQVRGTGATTAAAVSIAHSHGVAAALAALGPAAVGIDLENLGHPRETYESVAFSADERAWIDGLPEDLRDEWALRWWCSKEAVGKAMGRGLRDGPRVFGIRGADTTTGIVLVGSLAVQTAREADFVFAGVIHHD
jgi:phosphopantetheinyl transferase